MEVMIKGADPFATNTILKQLPVVIQEDDTTVSRESGSSGAPRSNYSTSASENVKRDTGTKASFTTPDDTPCLSFTSSTTHTHTSQERSGGVHQRGNILKQDNSPYHRRKLLQTQTLANSSFFLSLSSHPRPNTLPLPSLSPP